MADYAVIKAPTSYPSWKPGDVISDGTYTIATLEGQSGVFVALSTQGAALLARLKSVAQLGQGDDALMLAGLHLISHAVDVKAATLTAAAAAAATGVTTALPAPVGLTAGDWATAVPTTLLLAINRMSALLKSLNTNTAIP